MSTFVADLRFALRTLGRSPGFTVIALATLALGIGANTAIFSVVDAALLRPLPFVDPDRFVAVTQTLPSQGVTGNGVSYLNYVDLAERTHGHAFSGLAAIRMHDFTLTGRGEPTLVAAGTVTGNTFPLLGARPLLGRGLTIADDAPDAPTVAVLGEHLWKERFGGDRDILGKTISLDARPSTVVGVMPASFSTPPGYPPAELWLSLTHDPVFGDLRQRRGGHYLRIVGRVKDGISIARAQAEIETVQSGLARLYPKENEGWGAQVVPLAESLVGKTRPALLVLLGAVGLVFLIACANVANLLLARAGGRAREVAIRTALGAGRGRLIRQFLTECLVLALAGGTLGVLLAWAAMGALRAWIPPDLIRSSDIALDLRVLAFSFAVSLLAAIVFGLAPAIEASGTNLSDPLREGAAATGESGRRKRTRNLLVIGETAFSFVLLIGAGLLGRSFLRLRDVPLGFRPARVLTAGMSLPRSQYSRPEQWIGFYTRLVERLKSDPGVEGVTAALPLPLNGGGLNFAFKIEGRSAERAGDDLSANYTAATGDYFRVLRVPIQRGRALADSDSAASPKVCVISSSFARRFFPGENPIGRRLVFGFKDSVPREIVGIAGDVKRDGVGEPSKPEMYVPFVQDPWWASYIAIRTTGDPERLGKTLENEVRALDPSLPVAGIQSMDRTVSDSVAQPRFRTTLVALFAAAALLLAVIGIYGVLSYSVGRRTREVGIRMALGAGRPDILRLILLEGVALMGAGLAAGLVGAVVLTRYLSTMLFDVRPIDPLTYAAVAGVLLAAGVSACLVPAGRATRVDPIEALRYE